MKKTNLLLTILSLAVLAVLSACSDQSVAAVPSSGLQPLGGTSWKLVSYGPASAVSPAVAGVETNLTFGPGGQLSGQLGCNSMGGEYTVSGQTVTFTSIYATEMACDEPRMMQEGVALQVLSGTVSFVLSGQAGDNLILTSADGKNTLTFTATQ